jgi:hypothetical protein
MRERMAMKTKSQSILALYLLPLEAIHTTIKLAA